jgi:hypothetical protein
LESLIKEAEVAREVAEQAGNGSAMVAAIKLKAELTGQLNAAAPSAPKEQPLDLVATARAVFDFLREASLRTSVQTQSAAACEVLPMKRSRL